MEGRAIARPNPIVVPLIGDTRPLLQWRAGQLPGQTRLGNCLLLRPLLSFNGGPGNCPAKLEPHRQGEMPPQPFNGGPGNCPAKPQQAHSTDHSIEPSMEGRAIARPNGLDEHRHRLAGLAPSMEGRAIARPNRRLDRRGQHDLQPSMEGRAIARPNLRSMPTSTPKPHDLQWRAGQLPGQTGSCST